MPLYCQPDYRATGENCNGTLSGPTRSLDGIQGILARSTGSVEPAGAGNVSGLILIEKLLDMEMRLSFIGL